MQQEDGPTHAGWGLRLLCRSGASRGGFRSCVRRLPPGMGTHSAAPQTTRTPLAFHWRAFPSSDFGVCRQAVCASQTSTCDRSLGSPPASVSTERWHPKQLTRDLHMTLGRVLRTPFSRGSWAGRGRDPRLSGAPPQPRSGAPRPPALRRPAPRGGGALVPESLQIPPTRFLFTFRLKLSDFHCRVLTSPTFCFRV